MNLDVRLIASFIREVAGRMPDHYECESVDSLVLLAGSPVVVLACDLKTFSYLQENNVDAVCLVEIDKDASLRLGAYGNVWLTSPLRSIRLALH